jgi:Asp/Glu/hydantoin racemase
MNLLVINPNISESVTRLIEAEARRSAAPQTRLTMLTAPFGVEYIETRFEALVGGYAAACLAAERWRGHDAVIVAAFGDPGLPALRELLPIPVYGMTESALASALLLGNRFGIVAISPRIGAWYRESVEYKGLGGRLAGIRCLDRPLGAVDGVQAEHAGRLRELCRAAVEEDGADAVILAGAPLAGLARGIRDELPVPLVDGVSSAVRHAESAAAAAPVKARAGSFARPPAKRNRGLPPALAALLDER